MDGGDIRGAGAPRWALDFVDEIVASSSFSDAATPTDSTTNNNNGWDLLFHMLRIADRLDVPTLAQITAAKIASRLCGWNQEQLEALFEQAKGVTPEEERVIRAREAWVRKRLEEECGYFCVCLEWCIR